jgi:hypothetical protein
MRKINILYYFLLIQITLFGQFKFDYKDSIKVQIGGDILKFPFAGGLNYAQFSEIDFDFDGDNDLFIFDRSSDNIQLFENSLTNGVRSYVYINNGAAFFPSDLRYRVALLDYDGDGKNDIFTYGVGGVKVYQNIGNQTEGLKWKISKPLIYSDYNGNPTNLFISSADIPAYVDVDGDTDIDILTFNLAGESVEYHKNMSIELYGTNDSLNFVLKNQCWGKFKEDPISFNILLNNQTSPCFGGNVTNPEFPLFENEGSEVSVSTHPKRHTGSTLLALDFNNSGVLDLVLGDVSSPNLNLLINGGIEVNSNSAMISQDQNFPSNSVPLNLQIFPAAFYLDVDFDNVKDLIVSGNAKNASHDYESVWYYKNFGTNTSPIFVYQTSSFLQEDMVEVGKGAMPTFVDLNGDGLEDMIVSNFFRYKEPLLKECVIYHFQNTGSVEIPELTYIEANFLNLTNFNFGLKSSPSFGDLNGDGDIDVILGIENGTLAFFENIAGQGNTAVFSQPILEIKDVNQQIIDVGTYAFPQIFDLNKDGLPDLIIGNKTGEIAYYENIGTVTNPIFEVKNDTLGNIDIAPFSSDAYATPHFFKWNDTTYLLIGNSEGKLHFYTDIDGNLDKGDSFNLVSDFFRGISVNAFSTCWVNDIDNDGKLDLFVGGDLGGVFHYEHNQASVVGIQEATKEELIVYPNPFTNNLAVKGLSGFTYQFIDVLGSIVNSGFSIDGSINPEIISSGFYYLRIQKGSSSYTIKVTK